MSKLDKYLKKIQLSEQMIPRRNINLAVPLMQRIPMERRLEMLKKYQRKRNRLIRRQLGECKECVAIAEGKIKFSNLPLEKQIKVLKEAIKKCSKASDPKKCREVITKKTEAILSKIKKSIGV